MVIYEKEKKRIIIPEGIGFVGSDCSKMYDIGFERGYESGYTSGQADCPECSGGTDCSSAITEAYQSGITEGINTQKSRMESITITANTAVTRTDGWNEITVNVPSESGDCSEAIAEAYQSGHTGGVNEQKAKLDRITITANTTVTREDGWSSVTVNVHSTECNLGPDVESLNSAWNGHSYFYPSSIGKDGFSEMYIYDNGYGNKKIADGKAQQKALLGSTAITENGTYTTNGDGWSSVTVNVASSGDCSQAIEEAYQSGCTYAFDAAAERGFTFSTSGVITVSEDIVISRDDYDFLLDTGTNDFKFIDRVPMSFPSQSGFTYLLKAGNHTYDVKNVITFSPERTGTPPAIYVAPRPSAPYHNITVQSFGNGVVTPQSQEFYLEVYGSH